MYYFQQCSPIFNKKMANCPSCRSESVRSLYCKSNFNTLLILSRTSRGKHTFLHSGRIRAMQNIVSQAYLSNQENWKWTPPQKRSGVAHHSLCQNYLTEALSPQSCWFLQKANPTTIPNPKVPRQHSMLCTLLKRTGANRKSKTVGVGGEAMSKAFFLATGNGRHGTFPTARKQGTNSMFKHFWNW